MTGVDLSGFAKFRAARQRAQQKAMADLFAQYPDNRAGRRAAIRSLRGKGAPRHTRERPGSN